jgi:hypothetical protein
MDRCVTVKQNKDHRSNRLVLVVFHRVQASLGWLRMPRS